MKKLFGIRTISMRQASFDSAGRGNGELLYKHGNKGKRHSL